MPVGLSSAHAGERMEAVIEVDGRRIQLSWMYPGVCCRRRSSEVLLRLSKSAEVCQSPRREPKEVSYGFVPTLLLEVDTRTRCCSLNPLKVGV